MVCKKCGCENLISEGDWLRCPNCGAHFFNLSFNGESATKKLEEMEKEAAGQMPKKRPVNYPKSASENTGKIGADFGNETKNSVKSRPVQIREDLTPPQPSSSGSEKPINSTFDNKSSSDALDAALRDEFFETDNPVGFTESNDSLEGPIPNTEEKINKPTEKAVDKPADKSADKKAETPPAKSKAEKKAKAEEKPKKSKEKKVKEKKVKELKVKELKVEEEKTAESEGIDISSQEVIYPAGKKGKKKGKNQKVKKKKSKLRNVIEFLIPIVCAVILALALKTFVFANAIVPSGSMRNTIEAGDRIIASRISYIAEDPQRYDIVIFDYPDDETQAYVKRIIGLPGETITVIDGTVFYSDSTGQLYKAKSDYITVDEPIGDYGPYYIPYKGETISVSGGYCYAENGEQVGGIDFLNMYCTQDDSGKYVVAENLYFCMGDNRNDSHDSRYWVNTYVAEDKIIGKVLFRYYPNVEKIE